MNIRWSENTVVTVSCPSPPLTIEDIGCFIESRVEGLYEKETDGQDRAQVQTRKVMKINADGSSTDQAPWGDHADQWFKDGETILADCMAITESMAAARRPQITEEELKEMRKDLRFDLNDRVLCYCGPRWLSGHVVGTAVPDEGEVLPYLVKTDPLPGLSSKTISVPNDKDGTCTQEICFDPTTDMHLVKAAATVLTGSTRPKLRFAQGEKVCVRLRNGEDGLERWLPGVVDTLWAELPGPHDWFISDDCKGQYPTHVAYQVVLNEGGWVYVHRDHHTLIRREAFRPTARVKGISKRFEIRTTADGTKEQVDHQSERKKRMREEDLDDSDDE
jgi:hypothetical protein